jgi:uncharacterized protein YbaR (Trm112 family)
VTRAPARPPAPPFHSVPHPTAIDTPFTSPSTGEPLRFVEAATGEDGAFVSPSSRSYPIRDGVARFVPDDVYASSFGMQWNTFSCTQLDRHNGTTLSFDRFRLVTACSGCCSAGCHRC